MHKKKQRAGHILIYNTCKINIDLMARTLPPIPWEIWLFGFSIFFFYLEEGRDVGISLEKLTNDSCKHNNATDQ